MNCSHCGSPILGKFIEMRVDNGLRIIEFHDNPRDCYIKEVRYKRSFDKAIRQEILLNGGQFDD